MCGGFVCSKNALIALNVVYIVSRLCLLWRVCVQVVGFVLIIVGAYAQQTSIVTSVPLVGGIIAMGVFLGVVAVFGIMTASRHHQVGLFFVSVPGGWHHRVRTHYNRAVHAHLATGVHCAILGSDSLFGRRQINN
jgi:disulfide bond formation protein DsbB